MSIEPIKRVFEFDEEDTCKLRWTFTLYKDDGKTIISSLHIDEREKGMGCHGHPKTIQALVHGLELDSIDIAALKTAACKRDSSCGQMLARCVEELRNQL